MTTCVGSSPETSDPAKSLVYGEILELDILLNLQRPITGSQDALFFIVIHQAAELWFLVILRELELARDAISREELPAASYRLRRVVAVAETLVTQIRSLTTLAPAAFDQIRAQLGNSSGFQSAQFREIEFLSGLKDASYVDAVQVTDPERQRLRRRLAEPSVRDALGGLLRRRRLDPADLPTAADRDPALGVLLGLLLDHDESFARWRAVHALVVERLIGDQPGTGGSTGAGYLRATVDKRFFPELWGSPSSQGSR